MKKIVIILVSFLVLFTFIMLNYLLWDKENLMEQRDMNKIEQDWLRGQNRTLQTTVEELEDAVRDLQSQKETQQNKIIELENQLREALEKENENMQKIREQNQALNTFKVFMEDQVREIAAKWFSDITNNRYEASYLYLDKEFTFFDTPLNKEEYLKTISEIESIYIQNSKNDMTKSFVVLQDDAGAYDIKARVQTTLSLRQPNAERIKNNLRNGANTLEITFRYNPDLENWVIIMVTAA